MVLLCVPSKRRRKTRFSLITNYFWNEKQINWMRHLGPLSVFL